MRTFSIMLGTILVAIAFANPAAAAHTVSRDYDVATPNGQITAAEPVPGATSDGFVDVGGVRFTGDLLGGEQPVLITVTDAASPDVRATACQDLNADSLCGSAGEPRISFCNDTSAGNVIATNGVAFVAGLDLVVFVTTGPINVSAGNPGSSGPALCPSGAAGIGTTGTVAVLLG